ncbi:cyclic-phosphate processing receiver domain-containing protein [Paenibacillus terrae]
MRCIMANKINLYVDDLRDCPDGFVVARTYYEAIQIQMTKIS